MEIWEILQPTPSDLPLELQSLDDDGPYYHHRGQSTRNNSSASSLASLRFSVAMSVAGQRHSMQPIIERADAPKLHGIKTICRRFTYLPQHNRWPCLANNGL